jgi:hypothetical protein
LGALKQHLLFTIGSQEFLVYDIAADKDVSAAWKTTGSGSLINGYEVGRPMIPAPTT